MACENLGFKLSQLDFALGHIELNIRELLLFSINSEKFIFQSGGLLKSKYFSTHTPPKPYGHFKLFRKNHKIKKNIYNTKFSAVTYFFKKQNVIADLLFSNFYVYILAFN